MFKFFKLFYVLFTFHTTTSASRTRPRSWPRRRSRPRFSMSPGMFRTSTSVSVTMELFSSHLGVKIKGKKQDTWQWNFKTFAKYFWPWVHGSLRLVVPYPTQFRIRQNGTPVVNCRGKEKTKWKVENVTEYWREESCALTKKLVFI